MKDKTGTVVKDYPVFDYANSYETVSINRVDKQDFKEINFVKHLSNTTVTLVGDKGNFII